MMVRDGEIFRPEDEDEDERHYPERREVSWFPPIKHLLSLGTACVMISAFVYWLGGQAVGPGQRAMEAEKKISAELAAFRLQQDSEQRAQDVMISTMKNDLLILITLRCYDVPVATLRDRGQYAAAARCEALRNTGQ